MIDGDAMVIVILAVLWAVFLGGCFLVLRDKKQCKPASNKWALNTAGRR